MDDVKASQHRTMGEVLSNLLQEEFLNLPIAHWGYFFPCHVAVWRFINRMRPGALGELRAGYKDVPYFDSEGADWFCNVLGTREDYLDEIERIWHSVADSLRTESRERGFVLNRNELPPLDGDAVGRLAGIVLTEVERAFKNGEI
jgi:hypothetical protein